MANPNQRLKLLLLTNDLGVGGVQRLVIDFAAMLDHQVFDIHVATLLDTKDGDFYRSELRPETPYRAFKMKSPWQIAQWFKVYRYLKREKFDIVFSQLFVADTIGRIASKLAGVPLIVTEIQNIIPTLPKWYTWIDHQLSKITDVCISTTQAVTDYGVNVVGFPREKIVLVPTNAVDHRRFLNPPDPQKFRHEFGLPSDAKIIVNIGRMVEQKGQIFLIRAMKEVIEREPKAYALVVGSGGLEENLKAEAEKLNLGDHLKFLGTRKDTPHLLMGSDVFAFPSIYEGQGLILFESFFSKIPIVASDTGGIPDVIKHEETGLLSPPGDEHALAKNILRVLNDPTLGKKMAAEAYRRYQDRTLEQSMKKLGQVLIEAFRQKTRV